MKHLILSCWQACWIAHLQIWMPRRMLQVMAAKTKWKHSSTLNRRLLFRFHLSLLKCRYLGLILPRGEINTALGPQTVALGMWGAWSSGMWQCVKGWVAAAVWRNVCRWQHYVQQRASQPRRPETSQIMLWEYWVSHSKPWAKFQYQARPCASCGSQRRTRTVFSSQYYFTNAPYSLLDWIIHAFIHSFISHRCYILLKTDLT